MRMSLSDLGNLIAIACDLDDQSGSSSMSNWRALYALGFFQKALRHGRSINTLVRAGLDLGDSHIDIGGIASLSRCMIEVHNAFHYLLEPRLKADEREMRHMLFLLNHSVDLQGIHSKLSVVGDDFGDFHRNASIERARKVLRSNKVFGSLEPKQQNHLLRGKSAFLTSRHGGKRRLPVAIESGLYNLFSHPVHSFGLGIGPFGAGSMTAAGSVHMLLFAIHSANLYLASTILAYYRLRRRAFHTLAPHTLSFLEAMATPDKIIGLVQQISTEPASNNSFKPTPLRGAA